MAPLGELLARRGPHRGRGQRRPSRALAVKDRRLPRTNLGELRAAEFGRGQAWHKLLAAGYYPGTRAAAPDLEVGRSNREKGAGRRPRRFSPTSSGAFPAAPGADETIARAVREAYRAECGRLPKAPGILADWV